MFERQSVSWAVCLVVVFAFFLCTSGFALEPATVTASEEEAVSAWIPPTDTVQSLELAPQPDRALWMRDGSDSTFVAQADAEGVSTAAPADDGAGNGLEISVKGDWVSKYMFRGFDILDDSGAWQPSVDLGLWDTGLHLNWWASYSSHDRGKYLSCTIDRHDLDEHDYGIYWEGNMAEYVDVTLGFWYYDFIHLDSDADFYEWYGVFTLSQLPLSPYFGAYYGHEKHDDTSGEGWNTTFGVSHSVPLGGLTFCGSDPLALDLGADVWYNGGQYNVDTGWTHATFGGSIAIPLAENLELTPGIHYQLSMEDTVNEEDEWWTTLSLAYTW
jgi:hypothetical protein